MESSAGTLQAKTLCYQPAVMPTEVARLLKKAKELRRQASEIADSAAKGRLLTLGVDCETEAHELRSRLTTSRLAKDKSPS